MILDWDIIDKMQQQEKNRLSLKIQKRKKFIDNFTDSLPSYIGETIRSNPNMDLLYVSEQLGLQKLYKSALDSIGYSVNDYILFVLSYYANYDNFNHTFDYHWLVSDCLCIESKKKDRMVLNSDLGKIAVYKNTLTSKENEYKLLEAYDGLFGDEEHKNECHILTYSYTLTNGGIAKTGIVNDVYGPMIHSWCEKDQLSIDLANGYIMESNDFDAVNKVSGVNEISQDMIIKEHIPYSYPSKKGLVRSLPYLMYKKN